MELASGLLFSVILVILAGLALRHALWLGRDDDVKRASDTISEFEHRTRSLHAALEKEQLSQKHLRANVEQAAHDLASVKQSAELRLAELKTQQEVNAELERQLADRDTERTDMQATIEGLRQQLRAVHNEVAEKDARLRDFVSDRQGHLAQHAARAEEHEQALAAAKKQIEAIQSEKAELTAQLTQAQQAQIELTDHIQALEQQASSLQAENRQLCHDTFEFESVQGELERAQETRHTQSITIRSLEKQLQEVLRENEHLAGSAEEAARLSSQLDEQGRHAANLTAALEEVEEDRNFKSQAFSKLSGDKQALEQRCASMEKELQFTHDQGKKTAAELQALQQEHEALLGSVVDLETLVGEQTESVSATRDRLREADIQRDDLVQRLKREQHERATLESQLVAARQEIERAHEVTEELRKLQAAHKHAQNDLEAQSDNIDLLIQERHEQENTFSALEMEAVELRDQLELSAAEKDQQQTRLAQLQCELGHARSKLDSEVDLRNRAEQQVQELNELLNAGEIERVRERDELAQRESRLASLQQEKSELVSSLESERRMRQDAEERLQHLNQHTLASSNERIEPNPDQGDSNREILSFDQATREDQVTEDAELGKLYIERPQHVDDLKRISGVGHVLEEKLNALGIYTYAQIMEWSSATIARFSELLSFKDRIERDQWVAQATRLHEETRFRAA